MASFRDTLASRRYLLIQGVISIEFLLSLGQINGWKRVIEFSIHVDANIENLEDEKEGSGTCYETYESRPPYRTLSSLYRTVLGIQEDI